jgi:hypothetical protein
MKVLMASTPATGHINPLLAIGRVLIAEGHELVCLTGSWARDRIEGAGAKFRALPPTAGAALLALGGWRVIHAVLAGIGALLLLAVLLGFSESAALNPANRLVPSVVARNYKLERDAKSPSIIRTVRNGGYIFTPTVHRG